VTALQYRCFVGDEVVAVHAMKEYEEVAAKLHPAVYKFFA
jgi:hypothetical protein